MYVTGNRRNNLIIGGQANRISRENLNMSDQTFKDNRKVNSDWSKKMIKRFEIKDFKLVGERVKKPITKFGGQPLWINEAQ